MSGMFESLSAVVGKQKVTISRKLVCDDGSRLELDVRDVDAKAPPAGALLQTKTYRSARHEAASCSMSSKN
jgi:hypothetical protein